MPFHRQLTVLKQGQPGRQPTKRRLAELTIRFMDKFVVSARTCLWYVLEPCLIPSQEDCEARGQPFQYKVEDVVLRRIDWVSRGTLKPVLEFVTSVLM